MGRIKDILEQRSKEHLLRRLRPARLRKEGISYFSDSADSPSAGLIDFSSNDYLSFSNHPALKAAACKAINEFGVGACASRLLSGDLDIFHELERSVAEYKGKESALLFNSGYQANVGLISALCTKDDVIFSDRLNHASIIDGIQLCRAACFRFNHNDMKHLEYLLGSHRDKFKEAFIITESVFSMEGDKAPLTEITALKRKYNCAVYVDEAHAMGIFGRNGSGLIEEEGLSKDIDYIMGTFGKALGSFGAYFACDKEISDYLINCCRSFIYSTALPPAVAAVNLAALLLAKNESFRREALLENARYFRRRLKEKGYDVRGESQIISLVIGDAAGALAASGRLNERGYLVFAVRPPTVPHKEARLRFSLTYSHNKEILEKLISDIYDVV